MEQDEQLTEERKRKFLIVLPVVIMPFLFLLFYSLGGGKGKQNPGQSRSSALSTTLPDPVLDNNRPTDKLSLYEQAEKDSEEQRRNQLSDPFAAWMPVDSSKMLQASPQSPFSYSPNASYEASASPLYPSPKKSPEAEMEQKIAQLEKALHAPDTPVADTPQIRSSSEGDSPELQRLEAMMQSLSGQSAAPDPELTQASSLMDKILDVQHPDRVRQRIREQSFDNKKTVYPVSTEPEKEVSDLLNDFGKPNLNAPISTNGFYDEDATFPAEQNALLASVHESQTLVSGATIKIRLEQDAYVQGQLIPKGSFVFGICSLNGERLEVTINSIRSGNSIFTVSLIAYDMDGLPGIRIPGSINRDASKESSERALQTLNMGSLDPSIGAQAASAGIEAAKNLLSRKVKLIKVTVKEGYPLLLAPDKSNF